jgi:ABC-type lipoprotein export system ATPase subunit
MRCALPEPLVSCRALTKRYFTPSGTVEALHSIDAAFARGEVTAISGPSGSGKSTLLRAIAGLDRPTSGELLLDGDNLTAASPGRLRRYRRERVTYVSQKAADNLLPHLSLREHAHDAAPLAHRLLTDVGLADRLDLKPIQLSGGEQARAAFALALARATPLILIDEPTAELDRDSAGPLLAAIKRHAGTGTAFLIATHDPDVTRTADRVLHLDRGRVAAIEPSAVTSRPAEPARKPGDRLLEARALEKSYRHGAGTVYAVGDATLDLHRGELGVLLGRSGSGKSTLLTLLAGWQPPDAGDILWAGKPAQLTTRPWAELSYLPQRFGLIPELTVRENVELPARLTKRRDALAPRIDRLLHRLGLAELANRLPPETSIGQQQRAALARALLLEPALLLADEPTSHQDHGWRNRVWQVLTDATHAGTACLVATHEEELAQHASRLWTIDSGVITSR